MKRVDPVEAHVSAQRAFHGERVEHRQRVNGQPNGYRAVSEAELREGDGGNVSEDVLDQADTISLSDLRREERHFEESNYWK